MDVLFCLDIRRVYSNSIGEQSFANLDESDSNLFDSENVASDDLLGLSDAFGESEEGLASQVNNPFLSPSAQDPAADEDPWNTNSQITGSRCTIDEIICCCV